MEKRLNRPLALSSLFFLVTGLFALSLTLSALFSAAFLLPLILTLTFGGLGLILFFRSPLWLLAGLIIIRMSLDAAAPYFSVEILEITVTLSQGLGASVALLGVLTLLLYKDRVPRFPLLAPFGLIFLWGSASLAVSIAPSDTLEELLRLFGLFTLAFLAYVSVRSRTDFETLLLAFFASAILPIAWGLYQFTFSVGFADEAVALPRIFGTFSHPNVYSLYLFTLIVFGVLFFFLFASSRRKKILTLLLLAILTGMLFLTFARVAWVALFTFAFFFALWRYRPLLLPLFFIPIILFVFSDSFRGRIADTFAARPDSSITWRQNLWHDVTTFSRQDSQWGWGSGMDTFPIVSESLRGVRFGSNDPHNDFVKFFVEGGTVGLLVYLAFVLSLFVLLFRGYVQAPRASNLRLAYGILGLLFLCLELAALSDNVWKNTPVQWLFFIALGALLSLSRERSGNKSSVQTPA